MGWTLKEHCGDVSTARLMPSLLSANLTQASCGQEAIQQHLDALFTVSQLENLG